MRKTFEVERPEGCLFWIVSKCGLHHEQFPAEFRAFDRCESFRRSNSTCGILYIDGDVLPYIRSVREQMEQSIGGDHL